MARPGRIMLVSAVYVFALGMLAIPLSTLLLIAWGEVPAWGPFLVSGLVGWAFGLLAVRSSIRAVEAADLVKIALAWAVISSVITLALIIIFQGGTDIVAALETEGAAGLVLPIAAAATVWANCSSLAKGVV